VGLIGTEDIQPVGASFPRLAKVTVRFGKPIGVEEYAGVPAGKARRQLTDRVMEAIAELSGQERVDAYNEVPAGEPSA
jgi:1-acyl-sn-glycerol-3-phosphate acyltransferase